MANLRVNDRLTIPAAELRERFARSGGPGGQNVNRSATKAELRWTPAESAVLSESDRARLIRRLGGRLTGDGDLIVTSSRTRDQTQNRRDARRKLAAITAAALERPRPRVKTRPGRAARERRLAAKKRRGELKQGRKPVDT